MSIPIFAEDSTLINLAPDLSKTISKLDENADKFDHIMAFFITLMAEMGYRVSCLFDEELDTWSMEMSTIPKDWKHPDGKVYEINFMLHKRKAIQCKLVAIPVGDWIVINLIPKYSTRCKTRSMSVNVMKHVNMFQKELGKFWHLKELALRFKNELLAPVHAEMMIEIGVAAPSLQGLPQELKCVIADMLDNKSRRNLEKICSDFSKSPENDVSRTS